MFKYVLILTAVLAVLLFLLSRTVIFNPTIVFEPTENFFNEPIQVSLDKIGSTNRSEIRYTTDGSDPCLESYLYTKPFEINQTTVIKAAIFNQEGEQVSSIHTHDFFIQANHDLPIISIVTEPSNLWDPEFGIYATGNDIDNPNYRQRGSDWQRPAVFHFYEPNQELAVKQDIGVRIHGGGSRELPQKSLRLYADMDNNQITFDHRFFPELEIEQFRTLVLRNGGTDWDDTFIRDALIHRITQQKTELDLMPVRPAVVYLNGEYWGLYFLRDRFDTEYFHQRYGVDHSKISILESPLRSGDDRGRVVAKDSQFNSDADLFNQLMDEAAVCRDCAHYDYLNQFLDLQNLIDYYIIQLHFNNIDWPYNNTEIWRYQNTLVMRNQAVSQELPPGLDGRFRWMLFDIDQGMAPTKDTMEGVIVSAKNTPYEQFIDDKFPWRNLFFNHEFLQNYLNRYANYLNTTLSSDAVIDQIDKLVLEIENEMPRQIERWKGESSPSGNTFVDSYDSWKRSIERLKVFADYRPEAMRLNSLEEFSYFTDGYRMMEIDISSTDAQAGDIRIHKTIILGEELPFAGSYFPKTHIELEALPRDGYQFKYWKGNIPQEKENDRLLKIYLDDDYQLQAVFEK